MNVCGKASGIVVEKQSGKNRVEKQVEFDNASTLLALVDWMVLIVTFRGVEKLPENLVFTTGEGHGETSWSSISAKPQIQKKLLTKAKAE